MPIHIPSHRTVQPEEIKSIVEDLGKRISEDYDGKELVLLGILKGSVIFYADLARAITIPVYFEFVRISSYRDKTTPGEVTISEDIKNCDLDNKHVLIIEDIVDTGNSLRVLLDYLEKNMEPLSINICTLLIRDENTSHKSLPIQYSGLSVSEFGETYGSVNGFVVGYGMDLAEKHRNLPYLGNLTMRF